MLNATAYRHNADVLVESGVFGFSCLEASIIAGNWGEKEISMKTLCKKKKKSSDDRWLVAEFEMKKI